MRLYQFHHLVDLDTRLKPADPIACALEVVLCARQSLRHGDEKIIEIRVPNFPDENSRTFVSDENGGFFVSRLKRNANPEIVEELRPWRRNAKSLVGEPVWNVVDDLRREAIDALVEVTFKCRAYRGQRSTDSATLRLVGLQNEDEDEYHGYLPNLPKEAFSPLQVAALYRARWEIELLFRELKSTYGLDELPASKSAVVEVLILASILTVVISRVLLGRLREFATKRGEDVTFPPERLARVFEAVAPVLADRVARYLGFDPPNLLELMYREAQKQQSRPLPLEQINGALARD